MKLCSGCFTVQPSSPCPSCKSKRTAVHEANPERTAKKASKYNAAFRAKRLEWKKIMEEETVPCARCQQPVNPEMFHLDHVDGRLHPRFAGGALWPSHPSCNMSAGGRLGKRKK